MKHGDNKLFRNGVYGIIGIILLFVIGLSTVPHEDRAGLAYDSMTTSIPEEEVCECPGPNCEQNNPGCDPDSRSVSHEDLIKQLRYLRNDYCLRDCARKDYQCIETCVQDNLVR